MIKKSKFALIHGPVATGKTATLIEAARQLVLEEKRMVIFLGPQHAIVDEITRKIGAIENMPCLRVGTMEERFGEDVRALYSRHSETAIRGFEQKYKNLNRQNGQEGSFFAGTLLGASYDKSLRDITAYYEKYSFRHITLIVDEAALINYPELLTAVSIL